MKLTVAEIKNAKPGAKSRKIFDGGGLYIHVQPSGGKWWRLKYRFGGKEKLLALGTFPEVPLKEARDLRDDAKRMIRSGIDPASHKKALKESFRIDSEGSFEVVAREWFDKHSPNWSRDHEKRIKSRLEKDLFPWIGLRPINEIKAPELLSVIRRIETRGALDTAHRALSNCGHIFRYAIVTGRAERDPSADLKGALPPVNSKNHAAIIDPREVGELLRAIEGYDGSEVTLAALKLAPLVFVRPVELRSAEWAEIDLNNAEWRIPAEKMKMRRHHVVPLSRQAVELLTEFKPLTDYGNYVFPSVRTGRRPMSENTINAAIRRLGYTKEQMTGHGFRSMASTLLNEQGWNRDAIERQLAHVERNKVRGAYNSAEYLPERRKMMQAWADYLDGLKEPISPSE
jgi:integrase